LRTEVRVVFSLEMNSTTEVFQKYII